MATFKSLVQGPLRNHHDPDGQATLEAKFEELDGGSAGSGDAGAPAGGGSAEASEGGAGAVHQTTITLTDLELAATDDAGVGAYATHPLYTFPEGAIMMIGVVSDLDLTKDAAGINDDWDGDVGVGSTAIAGGAAPATTEQDMMPVTATPQAVGGATTANGQSTATENVVFDGTTTAIEAHLNLSVDDADQDTTTTPTNLIVNGTVTLTWVHLGDY